MKGRGPRRPTRHGRWQSPEKNHHSSGESRGREKGKGKKGCKRDLIGEGHQPAEKVYKKGQRGYGKKVLLGKKRT